MTNNAEFDTVAHEARSASQRKYAETEEGPPRSVYGFTGLLLASVAALIKQYAFSEEVSAQAVEPTPAAVPVRRVAEADASSSGIIEDPTGVAAPPSSSPRHAASRKAPPLSADPDALVVPSAGKPKADHHAPDLPKTAGAANDNSSLRLPLAPAVGGTSQGGAAAAGASPGPRQTEDTDTPESGSDNVDDNARNRAPTLNGPVNLGELYLNMALLIGLTDLLANAADADGDTLSVSNLQASSGDLRDNGDGTWVFTPDHGDLSDVTFTYDVTDGALAVEQSAFLDLVMRPSDWIFGSEVDDTLVGTPQDDVISALGGNDIVHAGSGDDVIDAGDGDDIIIAGDGDDIIDAGAGNDLVFAGAGNDIVFGGAGNDQLFGEDGDDDLHGGDGDDAIHGGIGNDIIEGGSGADIGDGGDGDDVFVATASGQQGSLGAVNGAAGTPSEATQVSGGAGSATPPSLLVDSPVVLQPASSPAAPVTSTTQAPAGQPGTDAAATSNTGSAPDADVDVAQAGPADGIVVETSASAPAASAPPVQQANAAADGAVPQPEANTATQSSSAPAAFEAAPVVSEAASSPTPEAPAAVAQDTGGAPAQNAEVAVATLETAAASSPVPELGQSGDGDDIYDGGDGCDTYDLGATSADAYVDLDEGVAYSDDIGSDTLISIENVVCGSGDDTIVASQAQNVMTGGSGEDTFVFTDAGDTPPTPESWDSITDFEVGDRIDVSHIDSDSREEGNQHFTWHGDNDHFEHAGELRYSRSSDEDGDHTYVLGNLDDDEDAEFVVDLRGWHELTQDDFIGLS